MAQTSPRLKAARRVKRQNTLLHRQTAQLRTDMEPIIRRAQVEGQLLRALLMYDGSGVTTLPTAQLEQPYGGDIDVSSVAGTGLVEIRYIPTPLEQSKMTGSGTIGEATLPEWRAQPMTFSPVEVTTPAGVSAVVLSAEEPIAVSYAEPNSAPNETSNSVCPQCGGNGYGLGGGFIADAVCASCNGEGTIGISYAEPEAAV